MPVDNQTLLRLIKDVQDIRSAIRHVTSNLPLFDIANENTPPTLLADQNDYPPGNYDVLRLDALLNVSVTGISGGKKGRFLEIINVSAFNITLPHENGSSAAANRFTVVGGENIVLFPTARVRLYYDYTLQRWQIPDRPAWLGQYGVSMWASGGSDTQSIPSGATTQINIFTVNNDDWGMFDSANQKIVVPSTGVYTGILSGNFIGNSNGYRMFSWRKSGVLIVSDSKPAVAAPIQTCFSVPISYPLIAGDEIDMTCQQDSTVNLDIANLQLFFARVL